jgi:hypothetical protein
VKCIIDDGVVLSRPVEAPQALAKTKGFNGRPGRYQPGDQLLGFLNSL